MLQKIDTSRAREVSIDVHNYDNLPLAQTYTTSGVAIDLTGYAFTFYLEQNSTPKKTYSILAGDLVSDFLTKTGADLNVLNMQLMFQDIRDNIIYGTPVKLVQVVVDNNGNQYVHLVYNINGIKY